MAAIRRYLWIGAVASGLLLLAIGGFFIAKGMEAKATIRAAMAEEQVTTSSTASIPGQPVVDAATAQSQADLIKEHTLGTFGPYSKLAKDDPNRTTYLNGLTIRTSLNMAILGFGVADMAMGSGAVMLVLGVLAIGFVAPALFWVRKPEPARVVAHAPSGVPAPEAAD